MQERAEGRIEGKLAPNGLGPDLPHITLHDREEALASAYQPTQHPLSHVEAALQYHNQCNFSWH